MKKQIKMLMAASTMAILMAGCGGGQSPAAESVEEAVDTDAAAEDAPPAADELSAYEDPSSLPAYSYTGPEEYMDVISDYMIETNADDQSDVQIPFGIIVEKDETDPENITIYGSFNIDGYELRNTTLVASGGSRGSGAFHLKKADDGSVSVVDAELPEVDEDYPAVFAPVDGLYDRIVALSDEEISEARAEAIAGYVNTNGLNITQWQDYGWEPVPVANAPETPEEAQLYDYQSPLGYQMTYDLREFSLNASDGEDMFGKVEQDFTGTLMVVRKSESEEMDAALQAEAANANADDIAIEDAVIGDQLSCRRAEWNDELEDGRIFRYIGYAVPESDGILSILLETTYEEGGSEMSMSDLEDAFSDMVSSFSLSEP